MKYSNPMLQNDQNPILIKLADLQESKKYDFNKMNIIIEEYVSLDNYQ